MHDDRLQQLLMEQGAVSSDQLLVARQQSLKMQTPLADVLINSGLIAQRELLHLYATDLALQTVSLESHVPDSSALSLIPADIARTLCVYPLCADRADKVLRVAAAEKMNLVVRDALLSHLPKGWSLSLRLAAVHEILAAIDRCYGVELSIDGILGEMNGSDDSLPLTGESMIYSQPVVRLVDALLVDALRRLASDIHFEPQQHFVRIRYRIDGVLRDIRSLHKDYWPSMLVRIKVLCSMNITETRAPQDGHLRLMLEGREVDFRASSFPVLDGECVVIRVLDRQASLLQLEALGFSATQLTQLKNLLHQPQGLLFVAGPTGSGKTTTLYSLLNEIASLERNVITMEDPVECALPMVRQCSIDGTSKLDFAGGVRAMLRQDPDVILVGETRDQATSEMVLKAALTGHLVLTTLHSASALGVFYRLQDLGVKLGHLSELLLGVLAQRLVRKLCETCKLKTDVPTCLQSLMPDVNCLYTAETSADCVDCGGSGYRGRIAVVELLCPDFHMRAQLAAGLSAGELAMRVHEGDHHTLMHSALDHLVQGKTSYAEIRRVLGNRVTIAGHESSI